MNTSYRELFRIRIRHGYFANRRCPSLALSPTPACARMLDRYRCLFRVDADGAAVYCAEENGQSLIDTFDETTPFSFTIGNTDHALEAFTEMPSLQTGAPDESTYYFSNAAEHMETIDGEKRLLLHPPGSAFEGSALPVRKAQFVYDFSQPLRDPALQLFDVFDREVPKVWETGSARLTQSGKTSAFALNLSRLAPGRYRLKTNSEDPYDFYLGTTAAPRHWGVVEIFAGGSALASTLPALCQVRPVNGIFCAGQSFTISMEARKSIWRYYIISQSPADRTYQSYQIVAGPPRGGRATGSPAVGFVPRGQEKVGGKDAWVFESEAPIPLSEIPGDRNEYMLRPAGKTSGGVSLPYARTDNTRLENGPKGEVRMCSEIYVYL